jgi:hypothetical protein
MLTRNASRAECDGRHHGISPISPILPEGNGTPVWHNSHAAAGYFAECEDYAEGGVGGRPVTAGPLQ